MILVDTSVWIEVFRARQPLDLESLVPLEEVATCLPVIQEILQGIRDQRPFRTARDALFSMPVVESPMRTEVILDAVSLYRTARATGKTVRSSVDCLIAACAIRNDLEVLHRDRDFDVIASVSSLQQRSP